MIKIVTGNILSVDKSLHHFSSVCMSNQCVFLPFCRYEGTGRSLSLKLIQQLRQQSADSQQSTSAENRTASTARLAAGKRLPVLLRVCSVCVCVCLSIMCLTACVSVSQLARSMRFLFTSPFGTLRETP